jgi:hypothetical protein
METFPYFSADLLSAIMGEDWEQAINQAKRSCGAPYEVSADSAETRTAMPENLVTPRARSEHESSYP